MEFPIIDLEQAQVQTNPAPEQLEVENVNLPALAPSPLVETSEAGITQLNPLPAAGTRETANMPLETPPIMPPSQVREDVPSFSFPEETNRSVSESETLVDNMLRSEFEPEVVDNNSNLPQAFLEVDPLVGQDTPLIFDASGSYNLGGTIQQYDFDFGNGATYSESVNNAPDGMFDGKTTYQYGDPGKVNASVTVTDNLGQKAGTSKTVTVTNSLPIFLSPGDSDPKSAGIEPSTLYLADSGNTKDIPSTIYVEGSLDAVKNTDDNLATLAINEKQATLNNLMLAGSKWNAIANAYDKDGTINKYEFWLDANRDGKYSSSEFLGNSTNGEITIDDSIIKLTAGLDYSIAVRATDNDGGIALSFDTFKINSGPVFLNPGDTNPLVAGIENKVIGDPAHSNDKTGTPWIEGRVDAVLNKVGDNNTVNNLIAKDTTWTAIANAYDPDKTAVSYNFWIKDETNIYQIVPHDMDSAKSGQIDIDGTKFSFLEGKQYELKVEATDLYGIKTSSTDLFKINSAPNAVDDTRSVSEDGTLILSLSGLIANDSEPDGQNLILDSFTKTANGTLNYNGTSFTYVPGADFVGQDTFTYKVSDGLGGFDVATVTINVTPVNDLPFVKNDNYTTPEDSSLSIIPPGVLANDTDVEGPLTVSAFDAVSQQGGTVSVNPDGSFSYTPKANYNGPDSFTYTVKDSNNVNAVATVFLDVTPVNDLPIAVDNTYSINEGSSLTVTLANNILKNDIDIDKDPLTSVLVSGPSSGSLSLNSDGTFTYTPTNPNFNGTDTFVYKANDGMGDSNLATVTISVNPANDTPDAIDDSVVTLEDTPVNFNVLDGTSGGLDTDIDLDTLIVVSATNPTHGSISWDANGNFTYTPKANYNGSDSFSYTIQDPSGLTDTAVVNIVVSSVNDVPDALNDSYSTDQDVPLVISTTVTGVLNNDSDIDKDSLVVNSYDASSTNKAVILMNPDGTFTYTPDAGFFGTDTFTYKISDGNGGFDVATVTVSVSKALNTAPIAVDDNVSTNEDLSVNFNVLDGSASAGTPDSDPDLNTIEVLSFVPPVNGSITSWDKFGNFTYEPAKDFFGTETFTYTISDGFGGTAIGTVTIEVKAQNDLPVAFNDSYTVNEDLTLSIPVKGVLNGVLFNDTDIDNDPLTAVLVDPPASGTLDLSSDGSFTYEPLKDFFGSVTFTYRADDGTGLSNLATVTINVLNVDDVVDPLDDKATTNEDTAIDINVLMNDLKFGDPENLSVTATPTLPANGVVAINPDGKIKYTPNSNFYGTDTFTYELSDGKGNFDIATVTVTVNPIDDPVDAIDDKATTNEDNAVIVNVLTNDLKFGDPENLTVTATPTPPANGSVVINLDNTITYTPKADFHGVDTFTYQITDGQGNFDIATVTVTVNPINDLPVALDDKYTTNEDTVLVIPALTGVLANDTDADYSPNDALSSIVESNPANGSLSLNTDGSFTYTPKADFSGVDTFTYKVNDGTGSSNVATVTITVTPVDDPATGGIDVYSLPTPDYNDVDNIDLGDSLLFSLSLNEPDGLAIIGAYAYSIDGTPQGTYDDLLSLTTAINSLSLAPGTYNFEVDVKDSLGNITTFTDQVVVASAGPNADLLVLPNTTYDIDGAGPELPVSGLNPGLITFDASGTVPVALAPIEKYEFDFNNDGIIDYTETISSSPDGVFDGKAQANFLTPGAYNAKVIVTDKFGFTDSSMVPFVVNAAPTAVLTVGSFAALGVPATFFGNASTDINSNLKEYKFEIFDSSDVLVDTVTELKPLSDGKVSYTFNSLGDFKIKLTVTDSLGLTSSTSSAAIKVIEPPNASLSAGAGLGSGSNLNFVDGSGGNNVTLIGVNPTGFGNGQDQFNPPSMGDENFTNSDNSGALPPKFTGLEGLPGGFLPPVPPSGSGGIPVINADAWVTLTAKASNSSLGAINKYEFDFNNDGIIDFTEQRIDTDNDGIIDFTEQRIDTDNDGNYDANNFILNGYSLINPLDPNTVLGADLDPSSSLGVKQVIVEINPTQVFTSIEDAEYFINTFDIKASLDSNILVNPNKLDYGFNEYTITFVYDDNSTEIQTHKFYIAKPTDQLDTAFDGVTKFKYVLGVNDEATAVPHMYSNETQVISTDVQARAIVTDIFGLPGIATTQYKLNLSSLLPPIVKAEVLSFAHGSSEVFQNVPFLIDMSESADPDGSIKFFLLDLNNDGVYDIKQTDTIFKYTPLNLGFQTIKVAAIDDGDRLGNIVELDIDVKSNALPTFNPIVNSPFMQAFGFTTDDEQITFNANASDTDGTIKKWEFTFTYFRSSSNGAYYLNTTPDFIEWKGGYDYNYDGKIGVYGVDKYGNTMDERFDYSIDGKADGILNYEYDTTGNLAWKVAAYDNYGASSYVTPAILVTKPVSVNLNAGPEVINPGEALTIADASNAVTALSGAVIVRYEFDFDYSGPLDSSDGKVDGISIVNYVEWKGGYDHNNDGTIDSLEALDRADDGVLDGKFTGNYFYSNITPRDVDVSVRVFDNFGNQFVDKDTITINAAPDARINIEYADPKNPGLFTLIDAGRGLSSDDQDRYLFGNIFLSGIAKYEFNVFENGDVDNDGLVNELVYSYTETENNSPDGTWSGNTKFEFPEMGSYRVNVKVTDYFGRTDEAETIFQAYEGTPKVSLERL